MKILTLMLVLVAVAAWVVLVACLRVWEPDEPSPQTRRRLVAAPDGREWTPASRRDLIEFRRPVVTTPPAPVEWLLDDPGPVTFRAVRTVPFIPVAERLPLTARARWETCSPATEELEAIHA